MRRVVQMDLIEKNDEFQVRERMNWDWVDELEGVIAAGGELPPIDVFEKADGCYLLVDGWHRFEAHRHLKRESIAATVHVGSERDALKFALGSNVTHGLKLSRADKRKVVERVLKDDEWSKFTLTKIAKMFGVSEDLVQKVEKELRAAGAATGERPNRWKPKDEEPKEEEEEQEEAEEESAAEPGEPAEEPKKDRSTVFLSKRDAVGYPLPDDLIQVFAQCGKFDEVLQNLKMVQERVNALIESGSGGFLLARSSQVFSKSMDEMRRCVRFAKPYAVCVYCNGKLPARANCAACRSEGWMSEDLYGKCPPEKKRK